MSLKSIIIFVLAVFLTSDFQAQLSDNSTISILTIRQGDSVDNTFGHTAIWVQDSITGKSEIYNFGLFDFEEPGFLLKFLRGKLLYALGVTTKAGFFNTYIYQKRSILEQRLKLSQDEKNKIYNSIKYNYRPENRKYLYDFFFDNCSTRPRDLLYNNLTNITEKKTTPPSKTFRQLIDEYVIARPWMDFGIDLIIGKKADNIASVSDQMFLPEYFYKKLNEIIVGHEALVEYSNIILDYEKEASERKKKPLFTPFLFFGLLLLFELVFFIRYRGELRPKWLRNYDHIWFIMMAMSSAIILFMWFGTDHIATNDNYNILWINPLFFLLLYSKRRWLIILTSLLLLVSIIVGTTVQQFHIASLIIICLLFFKLLRYSIVR